MRFVDDKGLTLCLTISEGIKRDELLDILGRDEQLPEPHKFDDFPWDSNQAGRMGLLNVFEQDGFLITLENGGFLGVTYRVKRAIAELEGEVHYIALRFSEDNYQYVEVQDGCVLADFDPAREDMPEIVSHLFDENNDPRHWMIQAAEWRLEEFYIKAEWLELPTDTYVIRYRPRI
jgi:hypothetical protein